MQVLLLDEEMVFQHSSSTESILKEVLKSDKFTSIIAKKIRLLKSDKIGTMKRAMRNRSHIGNDFNWRSDSYRNLCDRFNKIIDR